MPTISKAPFTYFTFRFDYESEQQLTQLSSWVLANCAKYALFDEVSDVVEKKHIQGKLGIKLGLIQFRKIIKKSLTFLQGTNYSMAEIKEPDKYDSYICKTGKMWLNNIFDESFILAQVSKHEDLVLEFKNKKQKAPVAFLAKVSAEFLTLYPARVILLQTYYWRTAHYSTDLEKDANKIETAFLLAFLLKRLGNAVKAFDNCVLQRLYTGLKNSIVFQNQHELSCDISNKFMDIIQ